VSHFIVLFCFFFQAEDGIRDRNVTGVQTCALPICRVQRRGDVGGPGVGVLDGGAGRVGAGGGHLVGVAALVREGTQRGDQAPVQIGRASCRERVESGGGGGALDSTERDEK